MLNYWDSVLSVFVCRQMMGGIFCKNHASFKSLESSGRIWCMKEVKLIFLKQKYDSSYNTSCVFICCFKQLFIFLALADGFKCPDQSKWKSCLKEVFTRRWSAADWLASPTPLGHPKFSTSQKTHSRKFTRLSGCTVMYTLRLFFGTDAVAAGN